MRPAESRRITGSQPSNDEEVKPKTASNQRARASNPDQLMLRETQVSAVTRNNRRHKRTMSTKSSIVHGLNFHLYTDLLVEATVYLELEGVAFETGKNRLKVAIPEAVWEVMRQYSCVDLSMADLSDDKMRQIVESAVRERSSRYAQADESKKPIVSLTGLLIYGAVDAAQDEQIARGLAYYAQLRHRQRRTGQDIADLRQMLCHAVQPDEQ